jgi:type IVB pilus formation R64 PilN family outer membrane protein
MNTAPFRLLPLVAVSVLSGCAHVRLGQQVDVQAASAAADVAALRAGFDAKLAAAHARRAQQDVDRPWLAGAPQPVAREVTLPAALRGEVQTSLMFPGGRVDLVTLGEQVFLATGIQVRISPEALLPVEGFSPRLASAAGASGSASAASSSAAAALALSSTVAVPIGAHPLPRLLDLAAHRLGVYWKYEDSVIRFYRTETRVFNVRALTLKSSASASLGRSGKTSGGAFESTSGTRIESEGGAPIDAVKAKLEPFLTRAGVVVANGDASGLVVVTDTRDALDRVATYLDRENKALTRRVRLVFEEIDVVSNNSNEQGIDWNVLYARTEAALRLSPLTSLASSVAGAGSSIAAGRREWEGTALVIKAISEVGTIVRRTSVPLQTLNRRPVTHAVRTTFSYIDQVQVTTVASSAGTSTAPSVTQKEETVGSFLTLIPDAQDDGQILLSIAYDNTVAQPLKTLTFGSSSNQVQLQQKTIEGMGTVQQVELRPGQPVVISGFDRSHAQYDRRRVDEDASILFGGSGKATKQRATTVVIVTAQVEEGF